MTETKTFAVFMDFCTYNCEGFYMNLMLTYKFTIPNHGNPQKVSHKCDLIWENLPSTHIHGFQEIQI